jgi:GH15 family glucan-1,4-alpha-glucosidase
VDRWREQRDLVHAEVCARGFDSRRKTFTQYYGSTELDASLLMLPLVGFLSADDPRIVGTLAAIGRERTVDGLVLRYRTSQHGRVDGLPHGEGVFLPCSFWLADNYVLQGRHSEARQLFERLVAMANDLGLLAEEYDPSGKHLLGNFPQTFSHVSPSILRTISLVLADPLRTDRRRDVTSVRPVISMMLLLTSLYTQRYSPAVLNAVVGYPLPCGSDP